MRVGVRENIIKISDHGGFIKVGAEKTLYTCFEMNDFSVFNVDIDYFFSFVSILMCTPAMMETSAKTRMFAMYDSFM